MNEIAVCGGRAADASRASGHVAWATRLFGILAVGVGLVDCGASRTAATATAPDAGEDLDAAPLPTMAEDSGAPDGGFSVATHAALPAVVSLGGPVMKNPKVVPVSFTGDPLQGDIDAFHEAWAKTTYWASNVAEYGIAKPVSLAPIHVATPPAATVDDSQIQPWLASMLDGTHPEWPAPDGDTVYALYYPPGTTITFGGGAEQSCESFHGYHADTVIANGMDVSYAVISRCSTLPEVAVTGIQYVSAVASHEITEAITDPQPDLDPAYIQEDGDHLAWWLGLGEDGELMDMCTLVGDAFFTPIDFPYTVQRAWSNAAAKTNHDPCRPQPGGDPYFNSAPAFGDTVTFYADGVTGLMTTKGVKIPVGGTKTIEINLYSDAPMTAPWTVEPVELSSSKHLEMSLDKTTGQNGDKLELTIRVLARDPAYDAEVFVLESKLGTRNNLWFGVVGN